MAIQDNTIVGLRTQILGRLPRMPRRRTSLLIRTENWHYLHHGEDKPLIVISHSGQHYQALLTDDNPHQSIHKASAQYFHVEDALRELLDWTSHEVSVTLRR